MKNSLSKTLAAISVLTACAGIFLLFPSTEKAQTPSAYAEQRADLPHGTMISSRQTNALGDEVSLNILRTAEGKYVLADSKRMIYVYNMRNNTTVELKELYISDSEAFSDPYAVSAFEAIVKCYDFYADANNLGVSLRGIGGESGPVPIEILLHYGYGYANANYSFDEEEQTAYFRIGDGNPYGELYRTSLATDVLAHEYQHAITERSAGLVYLNESGAISEAVSDIMGALVEGHDPQEEAFWQTGENAAPAGKEPMRSAIMPGEVYRLNAAANLYQPCYRNHTHDTCDYGGVHYNSTVLTHMQYNLWRKLPRFFDRQRIGTLWYATLCNLTPNATFSEFAECFRNAALRLQFGSDVIAAIDQTLFESGIMAGQEEYCMVMFSVYISEIGFYRTVDELCVRPGEAAPSPADPEPIVTESAVYTFVRWRGDFTSVTANPLLILGDFSKTDRVFTVRFMDENDNLLKEEEYLYGEAAVPPELQLKEGDETYLYPFLGWDHSIDFVTESFTARPLYGKEYRLYSATFYSDDKLYGVSYLPYNTTLSLPDLSEETRALGEQFAGWYLDEACTLPAEEINISGDIALYAKWVPAETSATSAFPLAGAVVIPIAAVAALGLCIGLYCFVGKKKRKK